MRRPSLVVRWDWFFVSIEHGIVERDIVGGCTGWERVSMNVEVEVFQGYETPGTGTHFPQGKVRLGAHLRR